MPSPSMKSPAAHGCDGPGTWRPMRASGGARSADEVADHTTVTATRSAGEPAGATTGSRRKAPHERREAKRIALARRSARPAIRSAIVPSVQSIAAKIAWSARSSQGTYSFGSPACAASCGR